jgi:Na+-transporting NADH:ubiquinone oxidoreductase subunit NqrA
MKIALWVARRHRPFSIVEDPELLDIFTDLNNKVVTPSRYTVSRDVKEIFQLSRKQVSELLKVIALRWTIDLANAESPSRDILESCICVQTDGRLPTS